MTPAGRVINLLARFWIDLPHLNANRPKVCHDPLFLAVTRFKQA